VSETRNLKTAPFHPAIKSMWFFYGSEGIIADSHLFTSDGKLVRPFAANSENHFANFLRAVRSRKHTDLAADILEGHESAALCHIANISYRTGQSATAQEVHKKLSGFAVNDDLTGGFEKTLQYLAEAGVDLEGEKITLGARLQLDGDKEAFVSNAAANSLLSRVYRAPFVVPGEAAG